MVETFGLFAILSSVAATIVATWIICRDWEIGEFLDGPGMGVFIECLSGMLVLGTLVLHGISRFFGLHGPAAESRVWPARVTVLVGSLGSTITFIAAWTMWSKFHDGWLALGSVLWGFLIFVSVCVSVTLHPGGRRS